MLFDLREFYLPANFISIVIGLELAGYFLYQYNKLKILRLMYMVIILGLIMFGFIMSSKPFHELMNPKIVYPVTISFFIPFIGLVFLDPTSTIFRYTLAPIVIGVPLIAIFQFKLIRVSSKNLKRRMILILIGEIIVFGAVILGADIPQALFFQQYKDVLYTIAIPMFVSGLFIIFLGVYKFPVFLELNWMENLLFLFIIDNKSPKQLYIHDFMEETEDLDAKEGMSKSEFQDLFSRGLIGIDSIIAAITDTKTSKIEEIEQGKIIVLFEQGQDSMGFITYALLVKQEISSARYFLMEVKRQFEGFFKDLLLNIDSLRGTEGLFFSSFDIIIKNLISR